MKAAMQASMRANRDRLDHYPRPEEYSLAAIKRAKLLGPKVPFKKYTEADVDAARKLISDFVHGHKVNSLRWGVTGIITIERPEGFSEDQVAQLDKAARAIWPDIQMAMLALYEGPHSESLPN
jgi:hypothetical protein